jgi:hypothetical protein
MPRTALTCAAVSRAQGLAGVAAEAVRVPHALRVLRIQTARVAKRVECMVFTSVNRKITW